MKIPLPVELSTTQQARTYMYTYVNTQETIETTEQDYATCTDLYMYSCTYSQAVH